MKEGRTTADGSFHPFLFGNRLFVPDRWTDASSSASGRIDAMMG